MFNWLNGPGAAFRNPLPGSTNYLNAYDPSGRLIRLTEKKRAEDPYLPRGSRNMHACLLPIV